MGWGILIDWNRISLDSFIAAHDETFNTPSQFFGRVSFSNHEDHNMRMGLDVFPRAAIRRFHLKRKGKPRPKKDKKVGLLRVEFSGLFAVMKSDHLIPPRLEKPKRFFNAVFVLFADVLWHASEKMIFLHNTETKEKNNHDQLWGRKTACRT